MDKDCPGGPFRVPSLEEIVEAATARKKAYPTIMKDISEGVKPDQESSLSSQVGGGHYKDMAIQPIEYSERNKLSLAEGTVIKYVSRHRSKGGLEDLRKARHCLELLAELTYGEKL